MKTVKIKILKKGAFKDSSGKDFNFTEQDLLEIANSYNKQNPNEKHIAPLILGDHNLYDPETKLPKPAEGFVDSLEYSEESLYANILPSKKLVEAVRDNRYKNYSAGLKNKKLHHIAILGAVAPAIKGLTTLNFTEQFSDLEIEQITNFQEFLETPMNPLAELRAKLVEYINQEFGTEAGTKFTAKFDELAKTLVQPTQPAPAPAPAPQPQPQPAPSPTFSEQAQQEINQLRAQLEAETLARENAEFSAFVDQNITRILPKNKDLAVAVFQATRNSGVVNFSEKETTGKELFKQFIKALPELKTTQIATLNNFSEQDKGESFEEIAKKTYENFRK